MVVERGPFSIQMLRWDTQSGLAIRPDLFQEIPRLGHSLMRRARNGVRKHLSAMRWRGHIFTQPTPINND